MLNKRFYIENNEILDSGFFLSGQQQYVDVMNKLNDENDNLKQQLEDEKKLHSLTKSFYDEKQAEFDKLLYDYNKLVKQIDEKNNQIAHLQHVVNNWQTRNKHLSSKYVEAMTDYDKLVRNTDKFANKQLAIQKLEQVREYNLQCVFSSKLIDDFILQLLDELKGE